MVYSIDRKIAGFAALGLGFALQACTTNGTDEALSFSGSRALTPNYSARQIMYKDQDMNYRGGSGASQQNRMSYSHRNETPFPQNGIKLIETGSGSTSVPQKRPDVSPEKSGSIVRPRLSARKLSGKSASSWKRHFASYKVYRASFGDVDPINFKPVKPKYYPVHGVDVSRWQNEINWPRLRRQGANFAYIKATEGNDHLDKKFKENWVGAAKAGIPRGAYHFFYWCSSGQSQANWFIRNVPRVKGALPPVIDVEWNNESRSCRKRPPRAKVLREMRAFMAIVERHYGQKPVIYTAPDFYEDNLQGQFKHHSFWLRAVAKHPSKVYPGRQWAFWQYSGTGKSGGVNTKIDLNVFNGTEKNWRKWLSARVR